MIPPLSERIQVTSRDLTTESSTYKDILDDIAINEISNQENGEKVFIKEIIKNLTNQIDEVTIREEKISKNEKEGFNVFNCLTRHHLEELHSNFIYYLLNPKETHECNTLFLKLFFETIIETEIVLSELFEFNFNFDDTLVEREKFIGRANDNDIYGFIDLFISTKNLNIAIENKIFAGEQTKQIERYSRYCQEQNKKFLILYLTLEGNESVNAGNEVYFKISYKDHILAWLEKCIKETWKYPLIHVGIHYYKELLRNKILNITTDSKLVEIKDFILQEDNLLFLKYWNDIEAAKVPIRNQLRSQFFKRVSEELKVRGYMFEPVQEIIKPCSLETLWNKQYRGLLCTENRHIIKVDEEHFLFFCIEHNWEKLSFGLFGVKVAVHGQRDVFSYVNKIDAEKITNLIGQQVSELSSTPYWLASKSFNVLNKDLKFSSDNLNYDFAASLEKIVTSFIEEVEVYLSALRKTISELSKEMP